MRLSKGLLVLAALASVAGCGAPAAESVVPDGQQPAGDLWCGAVTEDELESIVGRGQSGRVLEVHFPRQCELVWADGDEARQVALFSMSAGRAVFTAGYVDRLRDGAVEALGQGFYVDKEDSTLDFGAGCRTGDETGPPEQTVTVELMSLTRPGWENLSTEELIDIGTRRLQAHFDIEGECPGGTVELSVDEWAERRADW